MDSQDKGELPSNAGISGQTGPIGPFETSGTPITGSIHIGEMLPPSGIFIPPAEAPDWLVQLVRKKHLHYLRLARANSYFYYAGRVVVGLCSALLPFVVGSSKNIATSLAVTIAVLVVLDTVLRPRENWELYSKASDLLTIAEAKLLGQYDKFKEVLDGIVAIESKKVEQLVDLSDLLNKVKDAAKSSY